MSPTTARPSGTRSPSTRSLSSASGREKFSSTTLGSARRGTQRRSSSRPTRPSTIWRLSSAAEAGRKSRLAATYSLETVQAVHRAGACRHERHLGLLAAVRADDVVHGARPAVAFSGAPCRPAFGTAPGLVLKPARLIELLLPRREEEIATAVTALQRPVRETHLWPPPICRSEARTDVTGLPPLALRGRF